MLKNFVDIIGIADPSSYPVITAANPNTQYIVEEKYVISETKPDIEQVNSVMIQAEVTNVRTIATPVGLKVIIDGLLNQKFIYTANDPVQSVHSAHFTEPFCTFIEIKLTVPAGLTVIEYLQTLGITLADVITGRTSVLIEDASVKLIDPRTIEKCIVLFLWTVINPALVPVP